MIFLGVCRAGLDIVRRSTLDTALSQTLTAYIFEELVLKDKQKQTKSLIAEHKIAMILSKQ